MSNNADRRKTIKNIYDAIEGVKSQPAPQILLSNNSKLGLDLIDQIEQEEALESKKSTQTKSD